MLKARVKRVIGVPYAVIVLRAVRRSSVKVGVAVLYHRVGDPAGDPRTELVPAMGSRVFDAQVRFLRRAFALVPAGALPAALAGRAVGARLPAAITFDDDLPTHVGAARTLRRRRVTATFFVSGASLDGPWAFWWERLQAATDAGVAGAVYAGTPVGPLAEAGGEAIHGVAKWMEQQSPRQRDDFANRLLRAGAAPQADAGMRADDVALLARQGFEIGFHTRRHLPLPSASDEELAAAMEDGRDEVERVAGPLTTIAYPFGYADARVAEAARRASFRCGFTAHPAALCAGDDPLLLGRVEAPLGSVGELAFTVARALHRRARQARRSPYA